MKWRCYVRWALVVWSLSLIAVGVLYILLYICDYEREGVYIREHWGCIDMISCHTRNNGEVAEAQLFVHSGLVFASFR